MTSNDMVGELVNRLGIDGALNALADYMEGQAEEYEDTPTGPQYDRVAAIIRKAARQTRETLEARP